MAKTRRTNSITAAITAVTAALRLESIPNPTAEQLEQIHQAKVNAADTIDNSNFVTMGENADDAIEAQHQAAEAEAEAEEQQVEADRLLAEAEAAVKAAKTAMIANAKKEEQPDQPPLAELTEQTE